MGNLYLYRGRKPPRVIRHDDPIMVGVLPGNEGYFPGNYIYNGTREALIVSHPHHRLRKTGGWSGGGPFYAYKIHLVHEGLTVPLYTTLAWRSRHCSGSNYHSTVGRLGTSATFWTPANVIAADASQHYATGYARARPGNPVASLGQFLIELKEMPAVPFKRALKGGLSFRNIPRHAMNTLKDFRSLGGEYLNVVFGWKPFVADLRKMYYLTQTIDKRLAQLVRENGKYIRRKAKVMEDTSTESEEQTYLTPYANVFGGFPTYMSGTTRCTWERTVKTRVWFSGSFRYYIPDIDTWQWDARARLALFGALPTPELLWEVMPWSWLIDWFSNVGDVVSNISPNAVDNLTLRYSFIMKSVETKTVTTSHVSHSARNVPGQYWPAVNHAFRTTQTVVQKAREGGGNPYGLNVQLPSLSAYQLSILAALGISRSRVK
uniref:Maturation n=2 Tax=Leviviricetes TaxID=2842243 RepID=A0A514D399_9VIRU|nr:MAG: hypothetical protein H4Bulk46663_000001 [Leviviridae sp.]